MLQHENNADNRRCRRWIKNQRQNVEITNSFQIEMTFTHENDPNKNGHVMHYFVQNSDFHVENIIRQNEINIFDDDLFNHDSYINNLTQTHQQVE